jgi:hypothetical protein
MMFIKVRLSSLLLIAAAFVLVFVSFNSLASAQSGTEAVGDRQIQTNPDGTINFVVPGGPGFVSVAGATFTPTSSEYEWDTGYGYLLNTGSSLESFYVAPITLPHGATVLKFVAYYFDNNAEKYINIELYRKLLDSFEVQTMASVGSIGANTHPTYGFDDSIQYATVDNQTNTYFALAYLPSGSSGTMGLIGVRVDYSFPSYVPLVNK